MQTARASSDFTEFDGNLSARVGSEVFPLPGIGDRALSPSRLETWATCGFQYFLNYVLEVSDRDDPERTDEISAPDRGSLIHSTLEDRGKAKSYNRVCDTRTGASTAIDHAAAFEPCDGWCHGGSCMVYVPFEVRYGDKRPECAKRGRDNRFALPDHIGTADGAP